MGTIIAFLTIALALAGLRLLVAPGLIADFLLENGRKTGLRIFANSIWILAGIALLILAGESRFP